MFPVLKARGNSDILRKKQTKPEMVLKTLIGLGENCLFSGHNRGKQGEAG